MLVQNQVMEHGVLRKVPLKSGGAVDNEHMRGRSNQGLISSSQALVIRNLYAGLDTSPGKLDKIDLGTFSKTATLTLDVGEDKPWSSAIKGNYLYLGLLTFPNAKIVKIDLSDFTKVATLTLGTYEEGDGAWVYAIIIEGNHLYASVSPFASSVPIADRQGRIVKINLSTFTKVSTLSVGTYAEGAGYDIYSFAVSGKYLYAGLQTNPGRIVKIDLSTFTKVSTLQLAADEIYVTALTVKGNYLYGALTGFPYGVVKVDLGTFSRVASILSFPFENAEPSLLAADPNFLYAGQWNAINKIALSTFTLTETLTLTGAGYAILVANQDDLYAGRTPSAPGKINKVDLSTFTEVTALDLDVGEDDVRTLALGP